MNFKIDTVDHLVSELEIDLLQESKQGQLQPADTECERIKMSWRYPSIAVIYLSYVIHLIWKGAAFHQQCWAHLPTLDIKHMLEDDNNLSGVFIGTTAYLKSHLPIS